MELPARFVERVLRDLGEAGGRALCAALDTPSPVSIRLNPAKCGADGGSCRIPREDAAAECAGLVSGKCAGSIPGAGAAEGADSRVPVTGVAGECVCRVPGAEAADGSAGTDENAVAGLLRRLGATERVPWSDAGWYLAARPLFTLDSDFHAGAYYVQEASSQVVGRLLGGDALRGARVLDLCAAPGGKTTLYASLVGTEGLVVANEIDRRRAQVLADNVRKWGTGNVAVTCCEPRTVCDFEAWFDVVAVDAPCSGEGMFRKDDGARVEWSEGNVRMCAARQDDILREAWRALRPGGTLLYSTCTFNRDEDEGSLERLAAWAGGELAEAPEVEMDAAWGVVCGRVGVFRTFRFYPHRARGEGFFAAVARKAPDAGGRTRTPKARRSIISAVDRTSAAELARWLREPERMRFGEVAGTCYAWYAAQTEAVRQLSDALPVICSGVALGQIFKGRLKPDGALALFAGLDRGAVPVAELGEEEALRYLRRQEIAAQGLAEGVNLVCARGRALGFAKRIGARVNNMYPNSLRIVMK